MPNDVWRIIRDVINDPSATKEVWAVIGRGLSRQAIGPAWDGGAAARAVVLQAAYYIQATAAAVAEAGATLRVFCPD
jgi:hypothetical protein